MEFDFKCKICGHVNSLEINMKGWKFEYTVWYGKCEKCKGKMGVHIFWDHINKEFRIDHIDYIDLRYIG